MNIVTAAVQDGSEYVLAYQAADGTYYVLNNEGGNVVLSRLEKLTVDCVDRSMLWSMSDGAVSAADGAGCLTLSSNKVCLISAYDRSWHYSGAELYHTDRYDAVHLVVITDGDLDICTDDAVGMSGKVVFYAPESRAVSKPEAAAAGGTAKDGGSGARSAVEASDNTAGIAVEISGSITCIDRYPADDSIPAGDVTVQLFEQGAGTAAYTAEVTDKTYAIRGVTPGTYELKVSRTAYAARTYVLTVEEENVVQDVEIHRIGDVNGDGRISTRDWAMANAGMNGKLELDAYALACADVDGSGTISYADLTKINEHVHMAASLGAEESLP